MSQNERKEPTFGDSETKNPKTVIPSLRITQSPGHTFTPVIRPAGLVKSELPKMDGGDATHPTGFAFSPIEEEAMSQTENIVEEVKEMKDQVVTNTQEPVEDIESVLPETIKVTINAAERVIPITGRSETTAEKNTKEGSSKHRRLGIVALLAVALGVAFWLLKPSTPETVEELQSQQGGSLPIEFRPVDEAEAQRQEAEAKAQAQAQQEALAQQQNQQQAQLEQQTQQPAQQVVSPVEKIAEPQPVQPVANELAQPQSTLQASQSQPMTVVTEKPATQGSVVYQPETPTAQVVQPKVEKLKASHHANNKQVNAQPKVKAVTKAEFDTKKSQNAQLDRLVKNVETGKPVVEKATPAPSLAAKTEAAKSQNVVTSSKTLSVPKGVSLMQVFRDNQLNISDVNAMSKVNNKVSSLKVNEKVTVRLDKNNRVVEMTIGSGGKFTRQADGTYRFK
jgi:opacity associated protein A